MLNRGLHAACAGQRIREQRCSPCLGDRRERRTAATFIPSRQEKGTLTDLRQIAKGRKAVGGP